MKQLASFLVLVLSIQTVVAEETYRSAREAYGAGVRLFNSRQYAASQAPFEAALKLMPDMRLQMNVHDALFSVYRETAQVDKAVASAEFLIRNYDRRAGRFVNSNRLAGFLLSQGKTDAQIARYEAVLKQTPDDLAALGVLSQIYARGLHANPARHAEVSAKLEETERALAKKLAETLEADAAQKPMETAFLLKDAAQVWLEAGDKKRALETAKLSQASPAEARTNILTYQWHTGLGDVFAECGEKSLALKAYEAALAASPSDPLKKPVQTKIDALNGATKSK